MEGGEAGSDLFPTQVRLLFAATGVNVGDLVLDSLLQERSGLKTSRPFPGTSAPCWTLPALGYLPRVFPISEIQLSVPSSLLSLSLPHPK